MNKNKRITTTLLISLFSFIGLSASQLLTKTDEIEEEFQIQTPTLKEPTQENWVRQKVGNLVEGSISKFEKTKEKIKTFQPNIDWAKIQKGWTKQVTGWTAVVGSLLMLGPMSALIGFGACVISTAVWTAKELWGQVTWKAVLGLSVGILSGGLFGFLGFKIAGWLGAPKWLCWLIAVLIMVYTAFDFFYLLKKLGILNKKDADKIRKMTHFFGGEALLFVAPFFLGFWTKMGIENGVPLVTDYFEGMEGVLWILSGLIGCIVGLGAGGLSLFISYKWSKKMFKDLPTLESLKFKAKELAGSLKEPRKKKVFLISSGSAIGVGLLAILIYSFKKKNESLSKQTNSLELEQFGDDNEVI